MCPNEHAGSVTQAKQPATKHPDQQKIFKSLKCSVKLNNSSKSNDPNPPLSLRGRAEIIAFGINLAILFVALLFPSRYNAVSLLPVIISSLLWTLDDDDDDDYAIKGQTFGIISCYVFAVVAGIVCFLVGVRASINNGMITWSTDAEIIGGGDGLPYWAYAALVIFSIIWMNIAGLIRSGKLRRKSAQQDRERHEMETKLKNAERKLTVIMMKLEETKGTEKFIDFEASVDAIVEKLS